MKTKVILSLMIALLAITFSSCNITNKNMKAPNNHVELYKGDFEFSEQLTGEGTQTRIIGIDWAHLFKSKNGNVAESGNFVSTVIGMAPIKTSQGYALYDVMSKNPGYDVVFYPQYETVMKGFPFIFQKSHTVVKVRLAKIKQ